jgi:hypothetical protein
MASARLGKATAVAKMALASAASKAYLRMSSSFDHGMFYDRRDKPGDGCSRPHSRCYHALFEGLMAGPFSEGSWAGKICGVVKEPAPDLMLFAPPVFGIESS